MFRRTRKGRKGPMSVSTGSRKGGLYPDRRQEKEGNQPCSGVPGPLFGGDAGALWREVRKNRDFFSSRPAARGAEGKREKHRAGRVRPVPRRNRGKLAAVRRGKGANGGPVSDSENRITTSEWVRHEGGAAIRKKRPTPKKKTAALAAKRQDHLDDKEPKESSAPFFSKKRRPRAHRRREERSGGDFVKRTIQFIGEGQPASQERLSRTNL